MNEPSPKLYLIVPVPKLRIKMLSQCPDNHSHELRKFNQRKLHTVCIFEGSPRFREGSDKCSPKADHPRKTVGHTPRENFNIQVLREVISSILWDKCWFFLVFFSYL